jgi:hypothetical protein
LAAQLVVTHRQMQRYERGLKRIGAARLHARAQTVGVAVGCLYVGLDEAAAKRPIGPHERLVLSTVRSVDASHGSRLLEVIPACRRRASAAGKSRGRGTFGAEHSLGQGLQRGRHLEVRDGFRAVYKGEGIPPIARRSRVAASASARATPGSS